MLELKKKELNNVQSGASISNLPKFRAYYKWFPSKCNTIKSWF